MGLDDGEHAQRGGALDEGLQDEGVQPGVQLEQVRTVSTRLMDLIGGDDEVID